MAAKIPMAPNMERNSHPLCMEAGMLPAGRRVSKAAWIIGYVVCLAVPFVCLRIERAISTLHCIIGVLAGLLVQYGFVEVLAKTNQEPLQIFIVMLLAISVYLVTLWQYLAGHRVSLWTADAERQWGIAGRFFGGVIAAGLVVAIARFHLLQG